MNKNELELRKHVVNAETAGHVINLLQHCVTAATILGSFYIIFQGLRDLAASSPDALGALSYVIEKMQMSAILGYALAALTTLGYAYERFGKKRAIRKLDQMRIQVEQNDPFRGSSNLDEHGHTPKN